MLSGQRYLWHIKWSRKPKIFTDWQEKLFNSCFREWEDINRDAARGREGIASSNRDSNNSYKIGPLARASNISRCCPCVSRVYPCRKSSHQAYSRCPFTAIGAFSFLVLRVQYPQVSWTLKRFFLINCQEVPHSIELLLHLLIWAYCKIGFLEVSNFRQPRITFWQRCHRKF